jgi:hypothetical protein
VVFAATLLVIPAGPARAESDARLALLAREAAQLQEQVETLGGGEALAERTAPEATPTPADGPTTGTGALHAREIGAAGFGAVASVPSALSRLAGQAPREALALGGGLTLLGAAGAFALRRRRRGHGAGKRTGDGLELAQGEDGELRELTWRFRSDDPIRIDHGSAERVREVLDEIEQLGRQLRSVTTGEVPAEAAGDDAPPAPPGPAPSGPPVEPEPAVPLVRFARREGSIQAAPVAPAAIPTTPAARPSRRDRYEHARRLLREGRGRDEIRAVTGLKAAELDLLRCAPGSGVPA